MAEEVLKEVLEKKVYKHQLTPVPEFVRGVCISSARDTGLFGDPDGELGDQEE